MPLLLLFWLSSRFIGSNWSPEQPRRDAHPEQVSLKQAAHQQNLTQPKPPGSRALVLHPTNRHPHLTIMGNQPPMAGLGSPPCSAGKLLHSLPKHILTPLPPTKTPKLILLLIKFISKDYLAEEK